MNKLKIGKLALVLPVIAAGLASLSSCGTTFNPGSADTDMIDVTLDTRGTTITMWTGFGSDMSKALEERLEEFTAKTGIIVKHESKGGYPNLLKAINLASTSGSYPNIANGYPDHFASYVKSNILLRLDGLIGNDEKRFEVEGSYMQNGIKYGADGVMLMDYNDFYKDYTRENETLEYKTDGTPYILGVPFNKSTEVMVYNSTLFDWCATNEVWKDKIFVPKTWAEVKSVGLNIIQLLTPAFQVGETAGKILASDGLYYANIEAATAASASNKLIMDMTKVTADSFRPFSYDSTANLFITLCRQYGASYTEVDTTKTGRGYAVFNSGENKAKTKAAMDMLQDLFDSKIFGIPDSWGELFCSNAFKAYKSVMNVGSTAGLANITSTAIATKCAPIPYASAEEKHIISQGTSLGLFAKGTDTEKLAAWKLMTFLSQQENGEFAAATGYYPTCDRAYNSDAYQSYLENKLKTNTDILRQESAAVNNDEYVEGGWDKFVDPGFRGSADIREQVDLIPGYLLTHKWDVEGTLEEVYKTIKDYVKK